MKHISEFKTKTSLHAYISQWVKNAAIDAVYSAGTPEFDFFAELIKRHPKHDEKFKFGFTGIKVGNNPFGAGRGIFHRDTFGKWVVFSWNKCIAARDETPRAKLMRALRTAIVPHVLSFTPIEPRCKFCGAPNCEVDHIVPFAEIAAGFLASEPVVPTRFTGAGIVKFHPEDWAFERRWIAYHNARATYQLLCVACHRTKTHS